jgi:hypothetical protein
MKRISVLTLCAVAFMLLAPLANAACPTGNPLQVLVGTWTFRTQGVGATSYVSAGQFTSSISAQGTGALRIVATTNFNGVVTRQESDAGSFQIFSDCSGGVLTLNLSTRPVVYEFFFQEDGSEIELVSIDPALPLGGEAAKTVTPPPAAA